MALLQHLDRERFDPWVACLVERGPVGDLLMADGVPVVYFDLSSMYSLRGLTTFLRLTGELRRSRTAVVQTYLFLDNVLGPPAARLAGVRAVATGRRTVDEFEGARHLRLYRMTNPMVDRIVVVSPEVHASVLKWERVAPSMITTIPNVLSEKILRARSDASEESILAELDRKVGGSFLFGTVGNIRPAKGHDFLVRAFHRVAQKFPDTHLAIVGDGPSRSEIETMAKDLGVSDRVHLVGKRASVAAFVDRFSAFVLPSRVEGMSNALLEALLLRKPCIAIDIGLPRAPDGGHVALPIPPGDEAALMESMLRVRSDPAVARGLVARAAAFADASHNPRSMAGQFEALYVELLDRKGDRR
jgi:glycosyltransferase involved in cell wall biosynthesis